MEPLSVVLVWNENDRTSVEKYIQYTTKMLSRDINKPCNRVVTFTNYLLENDLVDLI